MTVDWFHVLTVLAGVYAAVIAVFLVLENRSPQSTFAWLFLMLGFPVGGLIIYTLFGRGWKAFSRKNQLHTLIEGTALVERKAVMGYARIYGSANPVSRFHVAGSGVFLQFTTYPRVSH